jgi:fumarate hydratase class I
MSVIRRDDLIESIAAALQFISYYHPADYIRHLARARELEQSPAARDAIDQILTNSRMCAEGHRPLCRVHESGHGGEMGGLYRFGHRCDQ